MIRVADASDTRHEIDAPAQTATATRLSVVVSNFNGRDVLPGTLAALRRIEGLDLEVILVDDGSTDGSREWAEATQRWCRVIPMGRNTRRVNAVRNRGLLAASERFVFLMDHDIVVDESCLRELLRILQERDDVVCCTPRLLYIDDPSTIYMDGGGLHFLCISSKSTRGEPAARHTSMEPRPTLGSGIMLIDMNRARAVNYFDAEFPFGWGDDSEFHIRARLQGFQVLHVPTATCLHLERPHSRARIFGQLVNRHRILLTMYSRRSLVLLAPALLAFEACLFVASLVAGFADQYFAAWGATFRNRAALRARRRTLQQSRVGPDSVYLEGGSIVPGGKLHRSRLISTAAALVSAPLTLYWRLVRRVL